MAPPTMLHLPDGQNFTVTPVFSGLFFKSHERNTHHNAFPIGWTVVLNTEDDLAPGETADPDDEDEQIRRRRIHAWKKPTLQNDNLFISSISNPSSSDFKPAASPTRQIAMMLWVTLYWYFHQPEPQPYLTTEASKHTPEGARPKGEWRINVKRDGVFRGRNLIPKLERMGLIANMNSAVGTSIDDNGDEWTQMFVSRRAFWQIPGRLFLFTLQRNPGSSFPGSPAGSRPGSPNMADSRPHSQILTPTHSPLPSLTRASIFPFRVASLAPKPVPYLGPVGSSPPDHPHLLTLSDTALMQLWLTNPRVSAFWGSYTPNFLSDALSSRHSFPVIGMWDGVPFGYFEIYWVKEDVLGRHLGGGVCDWDRGLHVFVGEEWARGRVPAWLSSLIHWCVTEDYRTMSVCFEPRIDNQRFIQLLQQSHFAKEREVALPHKQSVYMRLGREAWEGPAL
ncbi:aerobactin siderophore biosynthesis protein iucB [Verticillium alfalfae VaMs.102]|uniref:Aerobactin siderophore biosynthesis protein iucB n=1 Tax=Verticillium alfalfae (strain VaMs.102 / ATCC MYA-4576 / FGSC 10136) TaxID=526221 RepID=C9SCF2_VERA1|nr:aerobactin siderophore biosynthesis protein iucB [Verticillium alfalfae VaMs.102]EEY16767.1 aerobactin siderophore biosynthesis protein iucB [Verticillium alfalfae VaMs.102]